jgi:hypothetical protein
VGGRRFLPGVLPVGVLLGRLGGGWTVGEQERDGLHSLFCCRAGSFLLEQHFYRPSQHRTRCSGSLLATSPSRLLASLWQPPAGCYFNLFRLMAKCGVLENLLLKEHTHTFCNKVPGYLVAFPWQQARAVQRSRFLLWP